MVTPVHISGVTAVGLQRSEQALELGGGQAEDVALLETNLSTAYKAKQSGWQAGSKVSGHSQGEAWPTSREFTSDPNW